MEKRRKIFEKLLIGTLFCIVLVIGLYYCNMKGGMNGDEVVTFGLANSHYATWICDISDEFANGDMTECVLTKDEITSYLTVDPTQRFDFMSVYANQKNDVHPPMYYWIINFFSSFFPSIFSKWIALVPNLLMYLGVVILIYLTSRNLFDDKIISASLMLLYGLSIIGLSTLLFIRMYILLTFFTMLLTYEITCLMKCEKNLLYPCIGLTILGGLLTQYNYVFYAFFVCAVYLIVLLIEKKIKSAIKFGTASLIGAGCLPAVYPYVFYQISHGVNNGAVSGKKSLSNLLNVSTWIQKIKQDLLVCMPEIRTILVIGALIFVILLMGASIKRIFSVIKEEKQTMYRCLIIIIPSILAFGGIAITAPAVTQRYFFHIIPLFLLIIGYAMYLIKKVGSGTFEKERFYYVIVLILFISIRQYKTMQPTYLYDFMKGYSANLSNYADEPCVYVDAGDWLRVRDETLAFLIQSEDVFIAKEIGSDKMKSYIQNHKDNRNILVYIDNTIDSPSNVLTQFTEKFGYSDSEVLFSTGGVTVYRMKG